MPKIRQKYDDYAKESLLREIRKCQGTADLMNGKLLADASGIPYQTLMRRLKTPGNFTLDEVRKLNNAIHLDPFVLLSFLGYSKKRNKATAGMMKTGSRPLMGVPGDILIK